MDIAGSIVFVTGAHSSQIYQQFIVDPKALHAMNADPAAAALLNLFSKRKR